MVKKESNSGVFALEFIGSLFYLFVVYELLSGAVGINALFSGTGAFWLPIFVSVSIISTIILFFYSFSYISSSPLSIKVGNCNLDGLVAVMAGITLVTLTMSSTYLLVLTMIGFIISFIGVMLSFYKK
ncbi:MAG: hypothetical protein ACP5TL_00970 [Candidatus Micrarchaeia archaeon]